MAGRPREFDRNRALEKMRDLFWHRGYEGTSMLDLVDALGIASSRIYAAFGSKEAAFREAIGLYEADEGGFADRALREEPTARAAMERILREAVMLYTRRGHPKGCMVVSSAVNFSPENERISTWLGERRASRTQSIIDRIQQAVDEGELPAETEAQALGDLFAASLHGLSVQARDGISRARLLASIGPLMAIFDLASNRSQRAPTSPSRRTRRFRRNESA